ncbi:MAG: hypothetical protein ABSG30_07895 [Steroidobacteraceae bacterium]
MSVVFGLMTLIFMGILSVSVKCKSIPITLIDISYHRSILEYREEERDQYAVLVAARDRKSMPG